MSRINNQIQHRISEMTQLRMKKKESQAIARTIYQYEHGNLKGYQLSKTFFIRSVNTAKAYRKAGEWFASWLKDVKGINKFNKVTEAIAGEYLQQMDETYSAWTVKQSMAAINKVFNFNLDNKELGLRDRNLIDIKRSRKGPDPKRPGLLKKYKDQILLINATGCRRSSVTKITYDDIIFENGIVVKVKLVEKGGKYREAPVLKSYQKEFTELINKYSFNHDKNMFETFDNHVAAHYYRHLYVKELYNELYSEIGNEEHEKYKGYDKEVLKQVSEAIGHNRINVVVDNYMY